MQRRPIDLAILIDSALHPVQARPALKRAFEERWKALQYMGHIDRADMAKQAAANARLQFFRTLQKNWYVTRCQQRQKFIK